MGNFGWFFGGIGRVSSDRLMMTQVRAHSMTVSSIVHRYFITPLVTPPEPMDTTRTDCEIITYVTHRITAILRLTSTIPEKIHVDDLTEIVCGEGNYGRWEAQTTACAERDSIRDKVYEEIYAHVRKLDTYMKHGVWHKVSINGNDVGICIFRTFECVKLANQNMRTFHGRDDAIFVTSWETRESMNIEHELDELVRYNTHDESVQINFHNLCEYFEDVV